MHDIDNISEQNQSVTATVCDQAALFGATPERDEFDNREVWDPENAISAVTEAFRIMAHGVAPDGTQLADERESLLWGFVNMLDAQTQRLDRAADRLLPDMRDLQREQDGSEIRSRELELVTDRTKNLTDRRDAFEQLQRYSGRGLPGRDRRPLAAPARVPHLPDRQAHFGHDRCPRLPACPQGPREQGAPAPGNARRGGRRQARRRRRRHHPHPREAQGQVRRCGPGPRRWSGRREASRPSGRTATVSTRSSASPTGTRTDARRPSGAMTNCSISSPRASSRSRARASRTIWSTRRASSVSRSSASPPDPNDLAGRVATRRRGPFFFRVARCLHRPPHFVPHRCGPHCSHRPALLHAPCSARPPAQSPRRLPRASRARGDPLFARSSHFGLSDAGRRFYSHTPRIVDALASRCALVMPFAALILTKAA